jgi:hypothetical protein
VNAFLTYVAVDTGALLLLALLISLTFVGPAWWKRWRGHTGIRGPASNRPDDPMDSFHGPHHA